MRKLIFTASIACLLVVTVAGYSSARQKDLLVIVTTEDPLTQLMSMVLATQSIVKGARVEVLLCGKAGELALRDSQEVFLKPNNTSPQMLLRNLISSGVKVEICPPYLPHADKNVQDLLDGVSVAKPPQIADRLIDENTNILSY